MLPVAACWPLLAGFSLDPIDLVGGLTLSAQPGWFAGVWTLDLNVGVTTQALGHLAAEQWLRGEVPWWNPYTGIGMPLAGEMQASALFLPFVLLLHFAQGALLLKLAMQILAAWCSHALFIRLGLTRLAAALGAMMFALCGTFAWLGHGPIMPIAFLPLFLLGIEHARTGGFRLIAAAVALSITAGFPETAYIDGLLALVWAAWRIATAAERGRLAARVALGGTIGLALAAPALWSFAHMLIHGTASNHAIATGLFDALPDKTPSSVLAAWLFPAIYGPILGFTDSSGQVGAMLGYLGGFLGALPLLLALAGLLGPRQRALRWILFGWVAFWIAGILQVPGITEVFYAVPMLRQTIVARYAIASWSFAFAGLAAFAIDDWQRGARLRLGPVLLGWLVFVIGALACGFRLIGALAAQYPGFWAWPSLSILWAVLAGIAALFLLRGAATPRRLAALAAVIAVDALAFFSLPLLSAPRHPVIDMEAVETLRETTGLQRFYTLGPYRPNYGAFFATPQLNHEYLPLPANWVDHVHTALDPSASDVMFRGDEPPVPVGQPTHAAQLLRHLPAFAALGVNTVVTPAGQNPFVQGFALPVSPEHASARALTSGAALDGTVPGAVVPDGVIEAMGLAVGTYVGAADGALVAELCGNAGCAQGTLPLAGVADNAIAMVTFARPLPVRAGETLRWRLLHAGGQNAVAIWMPPDADMPRLEFTLQSGVPMPARIYRDALMDIYHLPDAAPYFEAPCRLSVASRTALDAVCDTPSRLIRRELFFSGWQARINGAPTPVSAYGPVMQSVELPAGTSRVRFAYAPPYATLCWIAVALGLAALLPLGGLLGFSRRR